MLSVFARRIPMQIRPATPMMRRTVRKFSDNYQRPEAEKGGLFYPWTRTKSIIFVWFGLCPFIAGCTDEFFKPYILDAWRFPQAPVGHATRFWNSSFLSYTVFIVALNNKAESSNLNVATKTVFFCDRSFAWSELRMCFISIYTLFIYA